PVSPRIRTVASVVATWPIARRTASSPGLEPTRAFFPFIVRVLCLWVFGVCRTYFNQSATIGVALKRDLSEFQSCNPESRTLLKTTCFTVFFDTNEATSSSTRLLDHAQRSCAAAPLRDHDNHPIDRSMVS